MTPKEWKRWYALRNELQFELGNLLLHLRHGATLSDDIIDCIFVLLREARWGLDQEDVDAALAVLDPKHVIHRRPRPTLRLVQKKKAEAES
jgi:hypothetical protein